MAETANRPNATAPGSAVNNNNTNNNGDAPLVETTIQKWLGVVTLVLRILLWPLRRLSLVIFPSGDFDGLSAPVTAKAAQQFVSYLRKLPMAAPSLTTASTTTTANNNVDRTEPWITTGFAALQCEIAQTNSSVVLIYLHSPLHRQGQSFAKDVLLDNPTMATFLRQPHLECLGVSIHTAQGAQLATMLGVSSYPCLALLQPKNSGRRSTSSSSSSNTNNNTPPAMNLAFKAEGPMLLSLKPEQLVQYLNMTLQRHQTVMAEQEVRRIQREEETQLRQDQDADYNMALLADQERERQVLEEAQSQQRQQEEAEAAELAKIEAEEERLEIAKSALREAPASGGTRVRFNLPTGKKLDRRFHNDETIAALKAFLILHFNEQTDETKHIKNIGLSTSFPKKSYNDDDSLTLEETGLSPQAMLMVQDLDA